MFNFDNSSLLQPTDLKDYFQKSKEGNVFWSSFEEVFLKNYGNKGNKLILTPIVFKIKINGKENFAGKMITLCKDNNEVDIYKDLFESNSLLLLMSYLIKDHLQKMFNEITKEMTFKEIALVLGHEQFVVGERIRQLLISLCNNLDIVLKLSNEYE